MENKEDSQQSSGFKGFILYLVILGANCIGISKSDPWGFMGFTAAITIGGFGLIFSPFAFLIGQHVSLGSVKDIFSLDFTDDPPKNDGENKTGGLPD